MNPNLKKSILTAFKISISLGLMFWVLKQMDWSQIRTMFQQSNPIYLIISVLFFIFSQWVSVIRFNLFLRKTGIRISFVANSKLYLLGMFYNFFIPGGIGGDAYKAYVLSKTFNKSLKTLAQVVLVDRLMGLAAIGFIICIITVFISFPFAWYWKWAFALTGLVAVLFSLKLIIKFFHTHKKRIYLGFAYSVCIQIFQLACVWSIIAAFSIEGNPLIYMLMFMVSSVLSVISFAGIGVREAVFYYTAPWFEFNPDLSASIALSFSLITAFVSFFGIFFQFRKINLKK